MSPTQRALAHCKRQGWIAQVVERWNPYAKVRHDLFGCIDIVVLDGGPGGPLGVQVTSGANVAARLTKAREEPRISAWLAAPARFEVWGYRKVGKAGKRKLWDLRRVPLVDSGPHGAPPQGVDLPDVLGDLGPAGV